MLAQASPVNNPALQYLFAVVAGISVAAVLHLWHRGSKAITRGMAILTMAETVVDTIAGFGAQWTQAAKLAGTIEATDAEIRAIREQLGHDRQTDWISVERYLHDMRHETQVEFAGLAVTIQLLEKVAHRQEGLAGKLDEISARLPEQT